MEKNYDGFTYQRSVAFKDTDMAGVVHFTNLLTYVEEAEHAALASLGMKPISDAGGFPKVKVECDYSRPARFGDVLQVKIGIQRVSKSSLVWEFEIVNSEIENILLAKGEFVTAHVGVDGKSTKLTDSQNIALKPLLTK